MQVPNRIAHLLAFALMATLLSIVLAPVATRLSSAAGRTYYVSPTGDDSNSGTDSNSPFKTIQKAVDLAQPGDVITLASGTYTQDILSRRAGTSSAPIKLTGPADAVVKGGGNPRVIEINHDYITLEGFTVDGLWGNPGSSSGYRDKLLYALGKESRNGVNGLKVLKLTFKNAGGECLRLRYFAQHNEVAYSTFQGCGAYDFKFNGGGKNGEGVYIGTAPEQLGDGKNPTPDPDQSSNNWIHHNTFNTQGNECVDIKEASSGNIVEHNTCTGQRDPNSAGFDSRGNNNTFRYNESSGNIGAGVRVGGDTSKDGIYNDIYGNTLRDNNGGGIKFQRAPQGKVCGNVMSGNTGGNATGSYASQFNPTAPCEGGSTPPPATATPTTVSTPLPAEAPQVTGFNGVAEGTTLSGVVSIEAVVAGQNIAKVTFELSGAASETSTEYKAPYFFKGDVNGAPLGWDTTRYPNGNYTLKATAYDTAGQKGSRSVQFSVENSTSQPTATPTVAPTEPPPPTGTVPPTPSPVGCSRTYPIDGASATFIEAEQYSSLAGRFTEVADSNRSNGKHMRIPGKGMVQDPNTFLTFDVEVTNGGTFYVWLLGYGPSGGSDSFFVQVDNGTPVQANVIEDEWGWKKISGTIKLDNGTHVIKIKNREDGSSVDKFLLTKSKDYKPAGNGGAALTPACK